MGSFTLKIAMMGEKGWIFRVEEGEAEWCVEEILTRSLALNSSLPAMRF